MKEEFEKLVASGKISRHQVEPLLELTRAGFCMHRSWGFGKITTVDTVFCRFTIDFPGKPGHSMDLGFAADSLKPIPKDHILARKASDINALRQMAALHHLDLIKVVLESYGGKATIDQIQQVLVPDVITEDWKKWWDAAKREMKKDGHFLVPLKKSDAIVYQVAEVSLQNRLLKDFRVAKGLKAKLAVANEVLKNIEDLTDKSVAAPEVIKLLNADIATHQRTMPALAFEAIFLRDDLRQATGAPVEPDEISDTTMWSQTTRPGPLLDSIPAAKHKRALHSFRAANPEQWAPILTSALNSVSTKLCGEITELLIHDGRIEQLKEHLARLIGQHQASSELLLWLARERSDAFADILGPEVFRAMLTAIEREQFVSEKKSNRLRDYILEDQTLIVELLGTADLEIIKDVTRTLQLSPCFDDMDKRSLLARIVKSYPAVQSLISGEHTKQDTSMVVSWESLERRKAEYTDLVHKKIPANSKDIAVARSYGDLRENHEYKAAKEMQKILTRRKAELETQLVRARGTDFLNVRTDVVSIGTIVTVHELEGQRTEVFTILGAWDSEPEKFVISYLSPVAQALLNHKIGDEVEFEFQGAKHRFRVDQIAPFRLTPPREQRGAPRAELAPIPTSETPAAAPAEASQPAESPQAPAENLETIASEVDRPLDQATNDSSAAAPKQGEPDHQSSVS